MLTKYFVASVQYDDWKGTSAADGSDSGGPSAWLKENGYRDEDDVLVGIEMSVGENHGQHEDPVYISFLLIPLQGDETIEPKLNTGGEPIELKRVDVQMNIVDFLALFKRFNVAFSLKNELSGPGVLDGREFVAREG